MIQGYTTAQEMAANWDLSVRQIQKMCNLNMIPGVIRFGSAWAIPENVQKPTRTALTKPGPKSEAAKMSMGSAQMKIAVCEDDPMFRENLYQILRSCKALPKDAMIRQFSSGDALLAHYTDPEVFDIIFLDIEMPGRSGIETGHKIRQKDKNAIIIFLTSHKQYVFHSFKIEAFDYLVKPSSAKEIHTLLSRAVGKYIEQHYVVTVKWQEQSHILEVNEIVYIEGYDRHMFFHTDRELTEGSYEIYECVGKLIEYEEKLEPYGFLRCHQGFLVNMKYIKDIGKNTITTVLKTKNKKGEIIDEEINMSFRKKAICLETHNRYLARRAAV